MPRSLKFNKKCKPNRRNESTTKCEVGRKTHSRRRAEPPYTNQEWHPWRAGLWGRKEGEVNQTVTIMDTRSDGGQASGVGEPDQGRSHSGTRGAPRAKTRDEKNRTYSGSTISCSRTGCTARGGRALWCSSTRHARCTLLLGITSTANHRSMWDVHRQMPT